MSEREIREEAAAIAKATRRLLERERARGGADLLASGIAKARARGIVLPEIVPPASPVPIVPAVHAVPPASPMFEVSQAEAAAIALETAGSVAPAEMPTIAPPPLELTPPDFVAKAPPFKIPATASGPVTHIELPPFAEDLNPSAMGGGREALLEASLPVLAEVAAEARACDKCGLCTTRMNAVPGVGSARSGIVFVGEAPGADEDERGEPFVGRAGELLTAMIAGMNDRNLIPGVPLNRETVYICNVLKCRPPDNRNPLPHEIEACAPYVMRQLEALQPRVICCLGKFAAELLLGMKGTISAMRGKTYRWRGAKLIVTYHPAYCLRSPSAKRPVWDDLQRLAQEYLTD